MGNWFKSSERVFSHQPPFWIALHSWKFSVGFYLKQFHNISLSRFKSHCLRKPGRAKRWGSADFKDILVMQSLSHMNTNGRGLRNFKSFLSENDHPPLVFDSDEA